MLKNKIANLQNNEIGERLRIFAELKWGKRGAIKKLASELKVKPPSLYAYLKGESKPGAELLLRLGELDCDIHWLLTGKKTETKDAVITKSLKPGKKYFISYLSLTGHGSCEVILAKDPKNYKDIQKIAEFIEHEFPDQVKVVIIFWRPFIK